MSRCIIHVGMHKTGTSSIQQSLNGFANGNFVYFRDPDGHTNHSPAIFKLLGSTGRDRPRRRDRLRSSKSGGERTEADLRVQKHLKDSLRKLGKRNLLISGEGMMFLSASELQGFAGILGVTANEIDIVAYVRPPASYITSLVQQRVKGGSLRKLNPEAEYCRYQRSFSKFDEVFGRDRVHLWKFDPRSFPGGCVVKDFCSRLGIDLPGGRIVRVNESLSREAVGLLFTYRELGHDLTAVENNELSQQLMNIGSTRFRISPDVTRPLLEKYRSDIEWMEARLGQSLHEDLDSHQPKDVRDESDLLNPDPQAVSQLLALLGDRAPAGVTGENPEQVALLVHSLLGERVPGPGARHGGRAGRVRERGAGKPGDTTLKVTELIEHARQMTPGLLDGIPVTRAEALVSNVFQHMSNALAGTEEGLIDYAGLGRFRVRKVEREVDGRKITRAQISFRRSGAKADEEPRARGSNSGSSRTTGSLV